MKKADLREVTNQHRELTGGDIAPGVIHIGWSKFAPAFVGRMLQQVTDKGHDGFDVIAVNRSNNDPSFRALSAPGRNHVYYLMECNGVETCSPITVVKQTMALSQDRNAVVERMADPATRIVTTSVTQTGYSVDKSFQPDSAALKNDIAAIADGRYADTTTTMGVIASALHMRHQKGQEPFLVLSCDNISYNGDMTRRVMEHIAHGISPEFASYVENRCNFPNSVVDRVTPKQDFVAQSADARKNFGIKTPDPVKCEDYIQWVIENDGRFPKDIRTAFEDAGVEFTGKIKPHQDAKLKIFNAAHMICGVFGMTLGIKTVQDAMKESSPLRPFIDSFLGEMADGLRPSQPHIDQYVKMTKDRLSNESFVDEVTRLISSTSTKIDPRFFNSDALAEGKTASASAFAIASWMNFLCGYDNSGNHINITPDDHKFAVDTGLRPRDSEERLPIEKRVNVVKELLLEKQRAMVANGEMPKERLVTIQKALPGFLKEIGENLAKIENVGQLNALQDWLANNAAQPEKAQSATQGRPYPALRA